VRAVIVTGAGRAFCAGADLSAGAETFDFAARRAKGAGAGEIASPDTHRDGGGQVALRIFESLKPVIAAVNGAAVGVGATMLLPMDVRLAAETAKFGFVFTRRGIVPEACSTWFLPRVVGISTAMEWVASGRVFSAQEALARGLVRSVHAPDALLPAARALAREIADNAAPVSAALARRMLWEMLGADHPMAAHRIESRLMVARGKSADAAEGVKSFLEKRPAAFPLRVSSDMPRPFPWSPPRRFED
jgi:enoyl-CoA hydratase/carnithine racemase